MNVVHDNDFCNKLNEWMNQRISSLQSVSFSIFMETFVDCDNLSWMMRKFFNESIHKFMDGSVFDLVETFRIMAIYDRDSFQECLKHLWIKLAEINAKHNNVQDPLKMERILSILKDLSHDISDIVMDFIEPLMDLHMETPERMLEYNFLF